MRIKLALWFSVLAVAALLGGCAVRGHVGPVGAGVSAG